MNINIKEFIVIFIILFIIDFIYLYINQEWYKNEVFRMQKKGLNLKWEGVFIRYFIQALGLYLFILSQNRSLIYAFIYGIIIYGNYIGTNYATIDIFEPKLAIIDWIKGGIIMTITAFIYYKLF